VSYLCILETLSLSFARILFSHRFCFPEEVIGALASHEELAGGVSISRVGLELPLCPLVIGSTPRPTAPRLERGMGLCLRFFDSFISLCLGVLTFLNFLASVASNTTITVWADAINTIYNEIGGYLLRLFLLLFSIVVLMFLILSFSLDRFCHNLRSMDYWKLLHVNLEHQSLVSLVEILVMSFPFVSIC
jgi:hypothetical protein